MKIIPRQISFRLIRELLLCLELHKCHDLSKHKWVIFMPPWRKADTFTLCTIVSIQTEHVHKAHRTLIKILMVELCTFDLLKKVSYTDDIVGFVSSPSVLKIMI